MRFEVSHAMLTLMLQIHVDRYKNAVYSRLQSDPFLRSIITTDPSSTRFHACERFSRCDKVDVEGREAYTKRGGKHVVYVNPVTMGKEKWDQYVTQTKASMEYGSSQAVNTLVSFRALVLSSLALTTLRI